MSKTSTTEKEVRVMTGQVELRMDGDGADAKPKVRGYAAVFGKESENLGSNDYQFREVIHPGAFDEVLGDDVRALLNHDPNMILARSKNGEGTLRIGQDEKGLWYEFEAPDTQAGRDLIESIKRGDIDQSSFSFSVREEGQAWTKNQDGDGPTIMKRTINKVSRLYDVSPVTYPAYPDATVALRSLEQFREESQPETEEKQSLKEKHSIDHWQRKMDLIDKTAAN